MILMISSVAHWYMLKNLLAYDPKLTLTNLYLFWEKERTCQLWGVGRTTILEKSSDNYATYFALWSELRNDLNKKYDENI